MNCRQKQFYEEDDQWQTIKMKCSKIYVTFFLCFFDCYFLRIAKAVRDDCQRDPRIETYIWQGIRLVKENALNEHGYDYPVSKLSGTTICIRNSECNNFLRQILPV